MSNLENSKLEESAHERFICYLQDNLKFDERIKTWLFTSEELWEEKELGRPCEDAYDRIFDEMLSLWYEQTLIDPIEMAETLCYTEESRYEALMGYRSCR